MSVTGIQDSDSSSDSLDWQDSVEQHLRHTHFTAKGNELNHLAFVCFALFFLWAAPSLANDSTEKLAFQQSATAGDAEAQYELAFLYEEEAMLDGDIMDELNYLKELAQ